VIFLQKVLGFSPVDVPQVFFSQRGSGGIAEGTEDLLSYLCGFFVHSAVNAVVDCVFCKAKDFFETTEITEEPQRKRRFCSASSVASQRTLW
jgi:hypothetical protein